MMLYHFKTENTVNIPKACDYIIHLMVWQPKEKTKYTEEAMERHKKEVKRILASFSKNGINLTEEEFCEFMDS